MAVLSDMGIRGAGDEILQPMLRNRFRVEFFGMGGNDYLTLQVISTGRPKLTFDEVELNRYNSKAYIAARHTFSEISMVFESDIGGGVLGALKDQLEFQQRLIGMASRPLMPTSRSGSRYKFKTQIHQLDGDTTIFETWHLDGCWLKDVAWGELDYTASETLKVTATVRFDHARQDIANIRNETVSIGPRIPIV